MTRIDTGFRDTGYRDTGYRDLGCGDTDFRDLGYGDPGFRDVSQRRRRCRLVTPGWSEAQSWGLDTPL